MAKLELPEVPEARASIHGELLEVLKELQPKIQTTLQKRIKLERIFPKVKYKKILNYQWIK